MRHISDKVSSPLRQIARRISVAAVFSLFIFLFPISLHAHTPAAAQTDGGAYYVTVVRYAGGVSAFNPEIGRNDKVRSELLRVLEGIDVRQVERIDVEAYAAPSATSAQRELARKRTADAKWLVIKEHPELIPFVKMKVVSRVLEDRNSAIISIWLKDDADKAAAEAKEKAEAAARAEAEKAAAEAARQAAIAEAEAREKAEAERLAAEKAAAERAQAEAAAKAEAEARAEEQRIASERAQAEAAAIAAEKAAEEAAARAAAEEAARSAAETPLSIFTAGSFDRRVPDFAISTNLLYDAVTAANLGIELPIDDRWSIRADYTFPWWTWNDHNNAFQIFHVNLSTRMYLGERTLKRIMTGWYLSLSGGLGHYDINVRDISVQGNEVIGSLGGGYCVLLGRNWSLDFGLGAGPMFTWNRPYQGRDYTTTPIYQAQKPYIGLTEARIGLTYTFTVKNRRAADYLDQYGRILDKGGGYFGKGADGAAVKTAKRNAREARKAARRHRKN